MVVINCIKWQDDSVVLTLDPYASLPGHALSFIETDGSVSLSLNTDAATSTAASSTLSWAVTQQPWHDGDLLMLRIVELVPEVTISDLKPSITQGQSESFTVECLSPSERVVSCSAVFGDLEDFRDLFRSPRNFAPDMQFQRDRSIAADVFDN